MLYGLLALAMGLVLVGVFARNLWSDLTSVLTAMALVSMSWTAVSPVSVPASDVFVGLASIAALPGLLRGRLQFRLPWLALVASVAVAVSVLLNAMIPSTQAYAQTRFLTFGTAPSELVTREVLNSLNGLKLVIALLVIPALLTVAARDRDRLRSLTDVWALGVGASCAAAISDYVGVTHITLHLGLPFGFPGTRGSGLTNHPVHLASVAVMVLPIVLTWLVQPGWRRRAGVLLTLTLLAGVFVSGSRAGLVVAALVMVAGLLLVPWLRHLVVALALPVTLFGIAFLLLEPGLLITFLEKTRIIGGGGAGSDAARAEVVKQAIRDIKHRPLLGIGYDAAGDGHSVYLQTVAAGGVLCLGGLAAFTTSALSGLRLRTGDAHDLLSRALLLGVGAWSLVILFEDALVERYMYLPLTFLLVVAAVRRRESDELQHELARMASSSAARVPAAVSAQV